MNGCPCYIGCCAGLFPPPRKMIARCAWGRIVRMDFTLDLPDSELRDVVVDGAEVCIRLSAAAVSDDAGGRGWLASVQLRLSGATLHGDTTHAFGRIAEGRLRQDDRGVARLAVPGTLTGDVELALRLANGTQFVARGRALVASVAADARFAPDLSC